MSLLGQQSGDSDGDSLIGELIGTVLEQVDLGDILTGLLTDSSNKKTSTKKKSSSKKKSSGSELLGDLLGSVVKKLFK